MTISCIIRFIALTWLHFLIEPPDSPKNLKKESKFLTRAFQITYFISILVYWWIRLKRYLSLIFGFWTPFLVMNTIWGPIRKSYELNSGWKHTIDIVHQGSAENFCNFQKVSYIRGLIEYFPKQNKLRTKITVPVSKKYLG